MAVEHPFPETADDHTVAKPAIPPPTMMIRNVLVAASIAMLLNIILCVLGEFSKVRICDNGLL